MAQITCHRIKLKSTMKISGFFEHGFEIHCFYSRLVYLLQVVFGAKKRFSLTSFVFSNRVALCKTAIRIVGL